MRAIVAFLACVYILYRVTHLYTRGNYACEEHHAVILIGLKHLFSEGNYSNEANENDVIK